MQVKSKSGRVFDIPSDAETAKIREGMAADPDAHAVPDEMLRKMRPVGRPKALVTKERVTIRLSPKVTEYFRATGKGWQTRVDEALKEYVDAHK